MRLYPARRATRIHPVEVLRHVYYMTSMRKPLATAPVRLVPKSHNQLARGRVYEG